MDIISTYKGSAHIPSSVPSSGKAATPSVVSTPPAAVQKTVEKKAVMPQQPLADMANAAPLDIYVVRDNVFSLYKLPNGQTFTKVRDLRTGEQQVYPEMDALSFYEALQGHKGVFLDDRI